MKCLLSAILYAKCFYALFYLIIKHTYEVAIINVYIL